MSVAVARAVVCPVCATPLAPEALECPKCGEIFSASVLEPAEPVVQGRSKPALRERILFYTGIVLIILGGPGLALGSWLHDVLRIPFLNYNEFDVFGPVNRLVLALGLIVMIVGVVFLFLSLRLGTAAEPRRAA